MNKQEASGYLSAMIDGEGMVQLDVSRSKRSVRIFNTDRGIIDRCLDACNTLGIQYKVTRRSQGTKPCYTVWIGGRDNLRRLCKLVTLGSTAKQTALDEMDASYTFPPVPTKRELQRLLSNGLTHREIAERLGYKGHGAVQYHLHRHGLL